MTDEPAPDEPIADMIRRHIRVVPDFPRQGVQFQDITPLLKNPACLARIVERWCSDGSLPDAPAVDLVAAIESRGFLLGAPLAHRLGVGFVPLRKAGKLPWRTLRQEYQLEYGSECLEMHADAIPKGAGVLVVDDLLATGGTMQAALRLIALAGGRPVGARFLIELAELGGRRRLASAKPEGGLDISALYRIGAKAAS